MKSKILVFIVAFVMVFTLAACGGTEIPPESTPEPTPQAEPTPTPQPTPEPSPEPETDTDVDEDDTDEPDDESLLFDGRPFPYAFSAEDIFGNVVSESTLGDKELFFVYRWATWCGACISSFPTIAKMIEQYQNRVGFIMLLIDMDNAAGAVSIYEGNGIPKTDSLASICDQTAFDSSLPFIQTLNTGFIPEAVIIDPDGNIVRHISGGGQNYSTVLGMILDAPWMFEGDDVNIWLNKSEYKPGERIDLAVTNLTQEHWDKHAWIGVYREPANPDYEWEDMNVWGYMYTIGLFETFIQPDILTEPGNYEMRVGLVLESGENIFIASAPFSIVR